MLWKLERVASRENHVQCLHQTVMGGGHVRFVFLAAVFLDSFRALVAGCAAYRRGANEWNSSPLLVTSCLQFDAVFISFMALLYRPNARVYYFSFFFLILHSLPFCFSYILAQLHIFIHSLTLFSMGPPLSLPFLIIIKNKGGQSVLYVCLITHWQPLGYIRRRLYNIRAAEMAYNYITPTTQQMTLDIIFPLPNSPAVDIFYIAKSKRNDVQFLFSFFFPSHRFLFSEMI